MRCVRPRMRPMGEFSGSSVVMRAANKVAMLEPREWPHRKTDDLDLLTVHLAYS